MSLKASALSLLLLANASHLSAQSLLEEAIDLRPTILDSLKKPGVYSGYKGEIKTLPSDWACDDRRYFWSLNWRAELDDVEVDFDPGAPDLTQVRVILKSSSLRAMYYKRDGMFCLWSGGEGEISSGRIEVEFSLRANPSSQVPDLSLDALVIRDFGMRDVNVMYRTFFSAGFREASDGFADFVENNFNALVYGFLNSSLKKHINAAINKELDKRLKERESAGNVLRP